jgi:regulation of enolase protein 1 (concanavalin A-like superfamily)
MMNLPAIPGTFEWAVEPATWRLEDDGALTVEAGPKTDAFVNPADGTRSDSAPRLLTRVEGDFQLSARVRVEFAAQFDAGVLWLEESDDRWAKLCFERSPQGRHTVVSVVTRGISDDANGWAVDGDTVWLRVSRTGRAYAFHASTDGTYWNLVRHFALGGADPVQIGFEAQSPVGPGCRVRFDHIRFAGTPPTGLRDGS